VSAPDRLALIEARWRERGCPDGDFAWLLEQCKRLRAALKDWEALQESVDEAHQLGDGSYKP
jgi:hypothetical protein